MECTRRGKERAASSNLRRRRAQIHPCAGARPLPTQRGELRTLPGPGEHGSSPRLRYSSVAAVLRSCPLRAKEMIRTCDCGAARTWEQSWELPASVKRVGARSERHLRTHLDSLRSCRIWRRQPVAMRQLISLSPYHWHWMAPLTLVNATTHRLISLSCVSAYCYLGATCARGRNQFAAGSTLLQLSGLNQHTTVRTQTELRRAAAHAEPLCVTLQRTSGKCASVSEAHYYR